MTSGNGRTSDPHKAAAYGGSGWSPRKSSLRKEIGSIWGACGVDTEWMPLKAVMLHRPSVELEAIKDPNAVQMLSKPDPMLATIQHDSIAKVYRDYGISVTYVDPACKPPPNLMFVADLFFMTPEGAILSRPASSVRSGEERIIASRLVELGVPILKSVRGRGTFEGADAAWVNPEVVLLATGLRTNREGAAQVESTLREMGVDVLRVGLPFGAMHLMGTLRFLDKELALGWQGRIPYAAVEALEEYGHTVLFLPKESEASQGMALNFVTLGPKRILIPEGNPATQSFLKEWGVLSETVEVGELVKAAGGIGCLTGVLEREKAL